MVGRGRGRVVISMSLLYFMFQSILNTFAFGYFFGGKKLIIFTEGGYPPPLRGKFRENILIFEPFPNRVSENFHHSHTFEIIRKLK